MAGVTAGTLIFGAADDYKRLLVAALVLFAIGTLDDRVGLGVTLRLIAQVATAVALWAVDLGWTMLPGHTANLVLTIVWVVGITNAFNLMDNQDGATGSIGAVCGAGIGALALIQGAVPLGVIAFSFSGACLGFLPFNLAKPAKIFLGDGGSMPIGLLVACTIMAIPDGRLDWTLLFATAPLAGLPILDTTLVVVSRLRRGVPVLSGDRTHLTHRLLGDVGLRAQGCPRPRSRPGSALRSLDRALPARSGDCGRGDRRLSRRRRGGHRGARDRRPLAHARGARELSRVRVLRVIARMNLGGPAHQASLLSGRRLDPERYETLLVHGRTAPGEESMADRAQAEGAETVYLPSLRQPVSPLHDARALAQIRSIARRFRPHLVHTHTAKAGFLGRSAALLAFRPRPVLVHTFHGHVLEGYFGPRRHASIVIWSGRSGAARTA